MLLLSFQSRLISVIHVSRGDADLVLVSPVCAVGVVWDRLWTFELVEAGWQSYDISLARDITCKSLDRSRHLVDLGEHHTYRQICRDKQKIAYIPEIWLQDTLERLVQSHIFLSFP